MAKRQNPGKGPGSGYGILIGLGVVVLLLIAGTLWVGLRDRPEAPAGPERTAFWLAQPERPAAERRDMILLLEEDRTAGTLTVLVLPSRLQVGATPRTLLPEKGGGRQVQASLQNALDFKVHHHAVLGTATMEKLVNMTGGLTVDGNRLDGAGALAYLFGEPDVNRRMERAPRLLLGIMDAANQGNLQGGVRDMMALASGVETDLSLLDLPSIFGRWGGYMPQIALAPGTAQADGTWALDAGKLKEILHPDVAPGK